MIQLGRVSLLQAFRILSALAVLLVITQVSTAATRLTCNRQMLSLNWFVTEHSPSKEAGDIVQPLQSGVIMDSEIKGDLFDLCRGVHQGRVNAAEITYFKSVGTAIEDLAAAVLVYERTR